MKNFRLKSVSIAGYRSYDTHLRKNCVPLGNYNLIIGANGAGKSNFIAFLEMVSVMMTRGLRNYTAKQGGADSLLHFGIKETEEMRGKLCLEDSENDTEATYSFALEWNAERRLYFHDETLDVDDDDDNEPLDFAKEKARQSGRKTKKYQFGEGHFESELANCPEKRWLRNLWRSLSRLKVFHFNDTSMSSHMRGGSHMETGDFLRADGENLAAFLYRLQSEEQYQPYYRRIVRTVRRAMPQFDDFDLQSEDDFLILRWRQAGEEYPFGPHQLSDGALRFIALTTLLLQPPELAPGAIILDEPEIGLHPYALSLLSWEPREAGKNSQIILATQSPTLLNSFSCEDILTAEYDSTRRSSVLRRHSEEELKEWLNDYSLGKLWEKNVLGGLPI